MYNNDKIGCGALMLLILLFFTVGVGIDVLLTRVIIWIIAGFGGPDLADKFWLVFATIVVAQMMLTSHITIRKN